MIGEPVLQVEGLEADGDRGQRALHDVSLELRAGEILAVAGVAGNGQRELAEAITGVRPAHRRARAGRGARAARGDPRDAIRRGVAHVPEDRLGTGVSPGLSIAANGVLKSYREPPACRGPLLRLRRDPRARARADRALRRRGAGAGRRPRAALGRQPAEGRARPASSTATPRPRRRVADPRARRGRIETVQGYLRQAAADGVGVLLISEDLDEIMTLADRIAVLYEGRVMARFPPSAPRRRARAADGGGRGRDPPRAPARGSPAGCRSRSRRLAIVVAPCVGAVVLLLTGHNPLETYRRLFDTAFVGQARSARP